MIVLFDRSTEALAHAWPSVGRPASTDQSLHSLLSDSQQSLRSLLGPTVNSPAVVVVSSHVEETRFLLLLLFLFLAFCQTSEIHTILARSSIHPRELQCQTCAHDHQKYQAKYWWPMRGALDVSRSKSKRQPRSVLCAVHSEST
jgi:hypothetical protein